jgi:hypothetical protein
MSFLSKFKKIPHNLPVGTAKHGVGGFLVDKGERYGAAYAFGWVKGHYRERAMVRGLPVDLVAGAGLLAGSVLLNLFSGGRSHLADHAERFGDAGLMSYLNTMGTAKGASMAGRTVMALPGAKAGAGLPGARQQQVVGMVPPVAPGASFLSASQVRSYANRR